MSVRTGRNYRYAAAGNASTAAVMGFAGAYFSDNAIFIVAAALCVPALVSLSRIRADEIDYARARNAAPGKHTVEVGRVIDLAKNHRLVLFAASLMCFQLADASLLPLVGEDLAVNTQQHASIWMSGLIVVPQIVVAIFAPWVGYHSERKGRRPLLLIGFGVEFVRAVMLILTSNYAVLVAAQLLDGVSGAIIGVLTVIVITDLTAGTGRFNLASVSTIGTGFIVQAFGRISGFVAIAVAAGAAVALLAIFLSETKPGDYPE
jgi:hypothetical protein